MPKPWDESWDERIERDGTVSNWYASWGDAVPPEFEFGVDYLDGRLSVFIRPVGVTDWDQEIPSWWVQTYLPTQLRDQVMESMFEPDVHLEVSEVVAVLERRGFVHNPGLSVRQAVMDLWSARTIPFEERGHPLLPSRRIVDEAYRQAAPEGEGSKRISAWARLKGGGLEV